MGWENGTFERWESFPRLFPQSLIYGVCIGPQQFLSLDNISLFLHLRNILLEAVIFPETSGGYDLIPLMTDVSPDTGEISIRES